MNRLTLTLNINKYALPHVYATCRLLPVILDQSCHTRQTSLRVWQWIRRPNPNLTPNTITITPTPNSQPHPHRLGHIVSLFFYDNVVMNTDEGIGKTDNFTPGPDRWVSYTIRAGSLSRVSRVGRVTVWIRVSGRLRLGFSGANTG